MKIFYISLICLLGFACSGNGDKKGADAEPKNAAEAVEAKQQKRDRNKEVLDSLMGEKEYGRRLQARQAKKELVRQGYTPAQAEAKLKEGTKQESKRSTGKLSAVEQALVPEGKIYLPVVAELLTPTFVESLLDRPLGLELESEQHEEGSRLSRATWSWNDGTGAFHRLTVNLNANPLPGELNDWDKQTMDNFINKGLQFGDGRSVTFEEINQGGRRYAWSGKEHILKWFYDRDYTFNIAGIGASYGDKELFMKVAEELNKNIKKAFKVNGKK